MESKTVSRREALGMIGIAGAALAACNSASPTGPTTINSVTTTTTTTTTPASAAACVVTPSETAGPFPSITLPVRGDVREEGLLLNLAITVAWKVAS